MEFVATGNKDQDQYARTADFYDLVPSYAEREDVRFYVEMAREARGPVLELGCGTGRVLIPIARAGGKILGLDSSPPMLAICREKLSGEPEGVGARVELVPGNMQSFDLGRRFPLVITPFRPFQHLVTVREQLTYLESVNRRRVDGGRFILDVFNPSISRLAEHLLARCGFEVSDFEPAAMPPCPLATAGVWYKERQKGYESGSQVALPLLSELPVGRWRCPRLPREAVRAALWKRPERELSAIAIPSGFHLDAVSSNLNSA